MRDLRPEIDTFAEMEPAGLSHLHGDPEHPVPGKSDTAIIDDLPPAAVDAFVEKAGPDAGTALLMAELRQLGGALGRGGEGHGALARVDGDFLAFGVGIAADEQMGAKVERDAGALMDALAPYGHGRQYSNFAEQPVDAAGFYPDDVYARLREVRERVDPGGLMRANHVIG
jgi:hypothetical protein